MSNKIIVDGYVDINFVQFHDYKGTCLNCKEPIEIDDSDKRYLFRIIYEDDQLCFVTSPINANWICPHCFSRIGNLQVWKKKDEQNA